MNAPLVSFFVQAFNTGRWAEECLLSILRQGGDYDFETDSTQLHQEYRPGDEDLMNLIAAQTVLHRGTVYVLESQKMPDRSQVAAIFRY